MAVSTFEPEIEIWNVDVMDALQPVAVLGGRIGDGSGKKSKPKSKKRSKHDSLKPGSHTDSVLTLAWNCSFRNVLATGSADHTIKARRIHKVNLTVSNVALI